MSRFYRRTPKHPARAYGPTFKPEPVQVRRIAKAVRRVAVLFKKARPAGTLAIPRDWFPGLDLPARRDGVLRLPAPLAFPSLAERRAARVAYVVQHHAATTA